MELQNLRARHRPAESKSTSSGDVRVEGEERISGNLDSKAGSRGMSRESGGGAWQAVC